MSVVIEAVKAINWTDRKVLVACSGGVDSMVLLHALIAIGIQPVVLHVNYQLREEASELDEVLVRETASNNHLECIVHRCPVELTKKKGVNLQAEARQFRREQFANWNAISPQHVVVLGQHADDQLETFFLQLYRGSGTFGLGGMHVERNQLIRPFLELNKAVIYQYAAENNVSFREDESNTKAVYLRNLFRTTLLPDLLQSQPQLKESVLLFMRLMRERQLELDLEIEALAVKWEDDQEIEIEKWLALTEEQRIAFAYRVQFPIWAIERINELEIGAVGNKIELDQFIIFKLNKHTFKAKLPSIVFPWDFKSEEIGILPSVFDKETLFLDADLLNGKLELRFCKVGDRIASLGMKGTQLVSDVLKDAGIPLMDRASIPVLTDGSLIFWIPGIKVSRVALATKNTRRILQIRLFKIDCEQRNPIL